MAYLVARRPRQTRPESNLARARRRRRRHGRAVAAPGRDLGGGCEDRVGRRPCERRPTPDARAGELLHPSAPGRIRTCDLSLRRRALYPLSYGRLRLQPTVCDPSDRMDLSLFFAGTAGSVPTARRGLPALLLRRGGDRLLFDCGEGTQRQLLRSVGLPDVAAIFLTHLHADHWLGLPGMLKSFDLRDRARAAGPLRAARHARPARGRRAASTGRLGYPFTRHRARAPATTLAFDGYAVQAFAVRHRGPAFGYALVEEPAARALRRRARGAAGRDPRAGLRAPAARRGRRRRLARAGRGPRAARPAHRPLGRHGAVRHAAGRRARGRRARARGDLPRRGAPSGPPRPLHSTAAPGRRDRARGRRAPARADAPLDPLHRPRHPRRGARDFARTVVPRDFDTIDVPLPREGRAGARAGRGGPTRPTPDPLVRS